MKYIERKPLKKFDSGFDIDVYTKEMVSFEQKNDDAYQVAMGEWKNICGQVMTLYGNKHKVYKYMKRTPPKKPKSLRRVIKQTRKNYQAHLNRLAKQKYKTDYRNRRKQAIKTLIDLGLTPKEDFKPTSAITYLQKNTIKVGDKYILIEKEIPIV